MRFPSICSIRAVTNTWIFAMCTSNDFNFSQDLNIFLIAKSIDGWGLLSLLLVLKFCLNEQFILIFLNRSAISIDFMIIALRWRNMDPSELFECESKMFVFCRIKTKNECEFRSSNLLTFDFQKTHKWSCKPKYLLSYSMQLMIEKMFANRKVVSI